MLSRAELVRCSIPAVDVLPPPCADPYMETRLLSSLTLLVTEDLKGVGAEGGPGLSSLAQAALASMRLRLNTASSTYGRGGAADNEGGATQQAGGRWLFTPNGRGGRSSPTAGALPPACGDISGLPSDQEGYTNALESFHAGAEAGGSSYGDVDLYTYLTQSSSRRLAQMEFNDYTDPLHGTDFMDSRGRVVRLDADGRRAPSPTGRSPVSPPRTPTTPAGLDWCAPGAHSHTRRPGTSPHTCARFLLTVAGV